MRAREAKDFLVRETAEQAVRDSVPLSDLEKQMMYFTEGPGAPEDPVKLNQEFEARFDNQAFEKKISRLMSRAYQRLKKENPEQARHWDEVVQNLQKGDHYILVLCGSAGQSVSLRDSPKFLLWLLLFCMPLLVVSTLIYFVTRHFVPPSGYLLRILQILFLALLIVPIFFPRILSPLSTLFDRYCEWVEDRMVGTNRKKNAT